MSDLSAHWPSSSRGAPVGDPGPDGSFSSPCSPLQGSADSSSLWARMELKQSAAEGEPGDTAQSHELTLGMKLEQLRQWQQHMQEQLRAQQLQELLRLQQEQHRLLEQMSSHCQDTAENVEESDQREATIHKSSQCQIQMEEQSPEEGPLTKGPQLLPRYHSAGLEVEASVCCVDCVHDAKPEEGSTYGEPSVGDRPINPGCTDPRAFEEMLQEQIQLEEQRLKSVQQPQESVFGGKAPPALPKRAFLKKGQGLLRFTGKKSADKDLRTPPPAKAVIRSHSEPISLQQRLTGCVQRKTVTVCKDFPPTSSQHQATKMVRLKTAQSSLRLNRPPADHGLPLSQGQTNIQPAEPCGGNIPPGFKTQRIQPESAQIESIHKERAQQGQVHCNQSPEPSAQGGGGARDSLERSFQERLLHWESARQQESVELGEFELLEQAAEELSFSSNSSFVLKVLQMDQQRQSHPRRLSSTPIKSPPHPRDPLSDDCPKQSPCESADKQEPSVPSVYTFPHQNNPKYDKGTYEDVDSDGEEHTMTELVNECSGPVLFDDHDTWSQLSEDHSFCTVSSEEPVATPQQAFTRKVAVSRPVEEEKHPACPAPSQLMSRLFPALKTQSHNETVSDPPTALDPCSFPNTPHAQQAQSQLLRAKLVELELQIEHFKKENASLTKLQKENQKVQEELRRERSEFEQLKAQEMSRFEEYKREESRKLQRERKLMDKHMSAARAVPNKSERHEIQALKQQLSSLQEELRRKESRWANTHSRQRQQLQTLEQDNSALREEVKTLEKVRLTAWRTHSTESDKSSAPKGVKFATPLDSSNTPPASTTRWGRRASAPGAATAPGMKSSLRAPSLNGRVEELEPEDQSQSSLTPEETQGCSPDDTQPVFQVVPHPAGASENRLQAPQEEGPSAEGKVEQLLSSGVRLIIFPNGTKKEVSANGKTVKVTFFNGDTKELTEDQRVIYFYAEAKTTHITYPDGMEVLHFPNKQTEKHFPDGHKEITFPDHTIRTLYPNGREESVLTDGTIIQVQPDGSKEIHFNTGQREVHTAEYKRREYPDGTVKTVYSDGRQETRYPTGRLRIKDGEGNIILDNRA